MSFQNLGQILGLGPPSTNQGEMGLGGGGGDAPLDCSLCPNLE